MRYGIYRCGQRILEAESSTEHPGWCLLTGTPAAIDDYRDLAELNADFKYVDGQWFTGPTKEPFAAGLRKFVAKNGSAESIAIINEQPLNAWPLSMPAELMVLMYAYAGYLERGVEYRAYFDEDYRPEEEPLSRCGLTLDAFMDAWYKHPHNFVFE